MAMLNNQMVIWRMSLHNVHSDLPDDFFLDVMTKHEIFADMVQCEAPVR